MTILETHDASTSLLSVFLRHHRTTSIEANYFLRIERNYIAHDQTQTALGDAETSAQLVDHPTFPNYAVDGTERILSSAFLSVAIDFEGSREHFLLDAIADLKEATTEAQEEGFPIPDQETLGIAERLLHEMFAIRPMRFEIYPTPDGEIAIDAYNHRGSSVILLCTANEGTLCLVNIRGVQTHKRYANHVALDEFLRNALVGLGQLGG